MISSLTQRCHCALINRGPLLRCLQGADPTFTLARGGTIVLCNEKGTISPKAADPHGMACKCFNRPCMLCHRLYGIVFKDEPESVHVSVTSYASCQSLPRLGCPAHHRLQAFLSLACWLALWISSRHLLTTTTNICKQLTKIRASQGVHLETHLRNHEIAAFACLPPRDSSCSINGAHLLFSRWW